MMLLMSAFIQASLVYIGYALKDKAALIYRGISATAAAFWVLILVKITIPLWTSIGMMAEYVVITTLTLILLHHIIDDR